MRRVTALSFARIALAALGLGGCSATREAAGTAARRGHAAIAIEAGRADHRIDAGSGVVSAAGSSLGFFGEMGLAGLGGLRASAVHGTLGAERAEDSHEMNSLAVEAAVPVRSWASLIIGREWRLYEPRFASQRWSIFRTGAEFRVPLANDRARGIFRAEVMPRVSVDGLPRPTLAASGSTGIEVRRGLLSGALLYGIERFDFSERDGVRRREQMSTLTLRAGLAVGR